MCSFPFFFFLVPWLPTLCHVLLPLPIWWHLYQGRQCSTGCAEQEVHQNTNRLALLCRYSQCNPLDAHPQCCHASTCHTDLGTVQQHARASQRNILELKLPKDQHWAYKSPLETYISARCCHASTSHTDLGDVLELRWTSRWYILELEHLLNSYHCLYAQCCHAPTCYTDLRRVQQLTGGSNQNIFGLKSILNHSTNISHLKSIS